MKNTFLILFGLIVQSSSFATTAPEAKSCHWDPGWCRERWHCVYDDSLQLCDEAICRARYGNEIATTPHLSLISLDCPK